MILYGPATETSIGRLFLAGVVPGMLLVLAMVVYRTWRLEPQWRIFRETVRESCMIPMITGAAAMFSCMMSMLYVTQTAAQWLVNLDLGTWVLLLAGRFLPPAANIVMVMPIPTPVLDAANFDPIWFAVMLTINMEVGLITPPKMRKTHEVLRAMPRLHRRTHRSSGRIPAPLPSGIEHATGPQT